MLKLPCCTSAGKAGTQSLADYVKEAKVRFVLHGNGVFDCFLSQTQNAQSLEQLFAMRADLQGDILLSSLHANSNLYQNVLQSINLSGNKLDKKAVSTLGDILRASVSLTHVYAVDCGLTKESFVPIIENALGKCVVRAG